MNLEPHIVELQRQLAIAASAGDDATRETAERLAAALEAATRLALLQALSEAAGEITLQLGSGSVDARLRGRDVEFVVARPASDTTDDTTPAAAAPTVDEEGATSRTTIRIPDSLKARAEQAANADGVSLNTWLVRAVGSALEAKGTARAVRSPQITGWVR
ncbi:YlcI/YnfO family protein [Microbacterium rhizophilus]|uniref:YlcI/YnfO family protein n=1 Tax=Microbacterium rhizophilus TaxID=3138934 RepID=UPI0031E50F63